MTNKTKKEQQKPFEDNFERMINPVKKLLAGIRKEDLDKPLDEDLEPPPSATTKPQEATPPNFTQVNSTQVKNTQVDSTQVITTQAKPTRVTTTQVKSTQVEIESNFTKVDNDILDKALMQLSASEFIVYLKLYRLSYGFHTNTCRIGRGKLTKICNLKSDKTVQVALIGLQEKNYIKPIGDKESDPRGTKYRIFLPQEIDNPDSSTRVKFTQVDSTQVKDTQVNFTAQSDNLSNEYSSNLGKNYLSKDFPSLKKDHEKDKKDNPHDQTKKQASGKTKDKDDDGDDDQPKAISDHQREVMRAYQEITKNTWSKSDSDSYQKISDIPLTAIEQGIKTACQRAPRKPNSLAYFIKEIQNLANQRGKEPQPAPKKEMSMLELRNRLEAYALDLYDSGLQGEDLRYELQSYVLNEQLPFNKPLIDEIAGKYKE